MRLVFFGTPRFAQIALERLLRSRHQVAAVVTAPDKPRGRGKKLAPSEVKRYALEQNLEVLQPGKLKDESFIKRIGEYAADLFAVVAFRILPEKLFSLPPHGTVNLHGSLLPKYRGAAPIEHALMAGETETGVTTFRIAKSVDTGGILMTRRVEIGRNETYEELYPRLAEIGANLLVETIDRIEEGKIQAMPQDDAAATAAPKISATDSQIDWNQPAIRIVNRIRGLAGSADAFSYLDGNRLKILRAVLADPIDGSHPPGEVIAADTKNGLIVAAGSGAVRLLEVCPAGKKRMDAQSFLNGARLSPGTRLTVS
jgi:methionyl-tRNA formyltransferase